MGMAYNNRCMTRVLAGGDLKAATADCDEALRLMPTNLVNRDTRGFVYLKLGKPELALIEYEAALKIDPNHALALFGRGIARAKLGKATEAEADKDAARALSPAIGSQFTAYGID
jgi:tetratricopeptide (TPR) repeat protein